jgi:hypothetical protein
MTDPANSMTLNTFESWIGVGVVSGFIMLKAADYTGLPAVV